MNDERNVKSILAEIRPVFQFDGVKIFCKSLMQHPFKGVLLYFAFLFFAGNFLNQNFNKRTVPNKPAQVRFFPYK